MDFGVTISLVSEVYFLSARPPLNNSTVSLVTVSKSGSPPLWPLLKVLWSVLRTITTLDWGWLNSWPCIVGGIIAKDCDNGPPTRGDLKNEKNFVLLKIKQTLCEEMCVFYFIHAQLSYTYLYSNNEFNFKFYHYILIIK